MEAAAQVNRGKLKLPYHMNDAIFLANNGSWDVITLRTTPHWLVEQVMFIWHLQDVIEKAEERKTRRG